jgi:hypothetical protein
LFPNQLLKIEQPTLEQPIEPLRLLDAATTNKSVQNWENKNFYYFAVLRNYTNDLFRNKINVNSYKLCDELLSFSLKNFQHQMTVKEIIKL